MFSLTGLWQGEEAYDSASQEETSNLCPSKITHSGAEAVSPLPPKLGATEKGAGVGEPKNQQMPTMRGTFIQALCQALHIISLNSCNKPMKAGATTPPSHFTDEELEDHRG